jgi:hypothetical protein
MLIANWISRSGSIERSFMHRLSIVGQIACSVGGPSSIDRWSDKPRRITGRRATALLASTIECDEGYRGGA